MPPSYRFGLLAMLLAGTCLAAEPEQGEVLEAPGAVLSWRQRPAVENRIMTERLEQLLPQLMEETDIDGDIFPR